MSGSPFDDGPLTVKTVDGTIVKVDLVVLAEAWTARIVANQDAVDDAAEEVHPDCPFVHPNNGWIFTARVDLQKAT
jgi:hypothetical protein